MYPNIERSEMMIEDTGTTKDSMLEDDWMNSPEDDWYRIFNQFGPDHEGKVALSRFKSKFVEEATTSNLDHREIERLVKSIDRNRDKMVDFEEFCYLMAKVQRQNGKRAMLHAAQFVVPKSQRKDKFRYIQAYNCCPPPFFIITATIIEVAVYIYYLVDMKSGISITGPVPLHSPLIYDPYRRYQAWRYISYMLVHIGLFHILFNSIAQLVIGLPLELVHKFWRIGIVYLVGVLAGSLAVSVCDPKTYLAGASGGVYALMAAHVANLVVNWKEMEWAWVRVIFVTILIGSDFGVAIYNRYVKRGGNSENVSFVAHVGGFLAGLLMGIVVLRNFHKKAWERVVWWVALVGAILLFIWAVLWNILYFKQYHASIYNPFLRKRS